MRVEFEKYINDTLEAKEFKNAFEYLFTIIEEKMTELQGNAYIKSANLVFIKAWEWSYGIPSDDSLTLEERRANVLLAKNSKPPYTKNSATQQIRAITGIDNELTEDELNLHINIDLTGSTKLAYNLVNRYMRKIRPTNVTYSISTTPPDLEDNGRFYMATFVTKNIVVI